MLSFAHTLFICFNNNIICADERYKVTITSVSQFDAVPAFQYWKTDEMFKLIFE
jgi:hypothetical protein